MTLSTVMIKSRGLFIGAFTKKVSGLKSTAKVRFSPAERLEVVKEIMFLKEEILIQKIQEMR